MSRKSERSKAASVLGKAGSKVFLEKYDRETRREWAKLGGHARAERHTEQELKSFAATAGRRPWKITSKIRKRILIMVGRGYSHKQIAARFNVSLRAVGRVVADEKKRQA